MCATSDVVILLNVPCLPGFSCMCFSQSKLCNLDLFAEKLRSKSIQTFKHKLYIMKINRVCKIKSLVFTENAAMIVTLFSFCPRSSTSDCKDRRTTFVFKHGEGNAHPLLSRCGFTVN